MKNRLPSRVMVVGSGAREHAIAWKLAQSPSVEKLFVAPGNDGMPAEWTRIPTDLSGGVASFERLAKAARTAGVELAVIGPDNALADGIVDVFEGFALPSFGPTREAAKLESSKAFSKRIMREAGVPTAEFVELTQLSELAGFAAAHAWLASGAAVVKADGLALGKGVIVCSSFSEVQAATEKLLPLSGRVLIEQKLKGEEISWMAICAGDEFALLDPARDFKRLLEGDLGPNTGGMGSFSPLGEREHALEAEVSERVFAPVLKLMRERGTPFSGVLYAGLMFDADEDEFWVLEFNARFGDPETQVLMPRVDGDILPWFWASATGRLAEQGSRVRFKPGHATYVVAAAEGYPESPKKGDLIQGVAPGFENVFFAGVKSTLKGLETAGGRVLGALGLGPTREASREHAHHLLSQIQFRGKQVRRDV